MEYLKKFNNHSDYISFTQSNYYSPPNVSFCVDESKIHYELKCLSFTALEPNSTIKLNRIGTASTLSNANILYSLDGGRTWQNYTYTKQGTKGYSGDTITLENVGDSVKFKGTNATLGGGPSDYHRFVMNGKIKSTGDVTSLFNEVGGNFAMPDYGCNGLFVNCSSLTVAPELPSTTLATYCYNSMFTNCTSLTAAPKLPATTLASYCYQYMFQGCTSLTAAPELPATTLAQSCYYYMFKDCTSLTAAPELPATTLKTYCYCYMFQGCTSLTAAPELPATTLSNYCYHYMFQGCSNLSYIKAMFTTTPSTTYTNSWVSGVASTGTFVKNSAAEWNVYGTYAVPTGWTTQTANA